MSQSTRAPEGHKICPRCPDGDRVRPLSEFYSAGSRGHSGYCKLCTRAVNRQRYRRVSDQQGRPVAPATVPLVDGRKCCDGKCGQIKLLSEFYRHGNGYRRVCKSCMAGVHRERYLDSPKAERAAKNRAVKAGWKCPCGEHDSDPAHVIARNARWREANREKHRKTSREGAARRRATNPEPIREAGRRAISRRRARLRGLPCEPYTVAELLERDGTDCVLCGKPLDLTMSYPEDLAPTREHLECLSWPGATAGDVPSNVAISHWKCNNERRDRPHPAAASKRAALLAAEQKMTT